MLTEYNAYIFRSVGFSHREIAELARTTEPEGKQPQPNLESPLWQAVLQSRLDWVRDKVQRDWSWGDITNEVNAYYDRDKQRSIYDFLRAEYRSPKKADYIAARRRRAAVQVASNLPGYYRKRY